MKLSELIALLAAHQREHGDAPVSIQNLDDPDQGELFVIDIVQGMGLGAEKAVLRVGLFGD